MNTRIQISRDFVMKKLNKIGKVIIALGILSVFRKIDGHWTFGGYYDNMWEIILTSAILITIGLFLIFISNKKIGKLKV